MIFLGIDPGYGRMGYGLITVTHPSHKPEYIDCGIIETQPGFSDADRLLQLENGIIDIISPYEVGYCAVEEVFFRKNLTTGVKLIQARGVILLNLAKKNIPIVEMSPTTIKKMITGHGKSEKKQLQLMVTRILGLKKVPQPDDAADGLSLAISAWLHHKTLR